MFLSVLAFFTCAVLLQWRAGAFTAEFSGSDEAAHFVTSLMIHDYVASGMPAPPVKFAENYYVRYPKVTFGIWPPLFHVTQAAWMLAFSRSRISVLVLMALWTALLAAGCYCAVRTGFGALSGVCLGIVLVSLPEVQQATNTDMPDVMMSCFIFAATLSFGRYLDHQKQRDALLFGLFASLGIIVKYNALALALVPPFALVFSRRFELARRTSFWLPVLVVTAICGPWYAYNRNLVRYAMEPVPGIGDIPAASAQNLVSLIALTGLPLFAVAVVGAFAKLRHEGRDDPATGMWTAAASLLAALWFFHSVLYPITQGRYLLAAAPVLLMFVAAGCRAMADSLSWRAGLRHVPCWAVLLAVCFVYAAVTFRISEKRHYGVSVVAAQLTRSSDAQELVLVSGPAETEGMLISEMALLDRRLRHYVLRASKVLARSTWMGSDYELLYQTPEQVRHFLDGSRISTVVVDRSNEYTKPHHRLLQEALVAEPAVWAPRRLANSETVQVYQRLGPLPDLPGGPVSVDLSRTLGKRLEVPQGRKVD